MPPTLNVLTLNCWGLKFISDHRIPRLSRIGYEIAHTTPRPDIVGLQECWTRQDYEAIRDSTAEILPHGKFYHSGCFGGGLAILSKWPIEESSMLQYPLNGRPQAFWRGDWYVGKGVACATLRTDDGEAIEVFCTHLHAPYEKEPNDSYICHRTSQAWFIAKLIRQALSRSSLVLALGDFNMLPLSLAHQIISTHGGVQDAWRNLYPESSVGAAVDPVERKRNRPTPTARFNIQANGATCDSCLNTWRWDNALRKRLGKGEKVHVDEETEDPKAKRLDYIFFGSESGPGWSVQSARVGMTQRHPTLQCSLSDHFSVEAALVKREATSLENGLGRGDIKETSTSNGDEKSHAGVGASPKLKFQYLPLAIYDSILALISTYTARERKQRRLRLGHFVGQFTLSVSCLVAVWWSPRNFASFLLMLLSTLGLSAGVIDGLIGGLFVGSELRALKEFEWEVRNARSLAAARGMETGEGVPLRLERERERVVVEG